MSRVERGRTGYHAGLEAERSVARDYLRRGYKFAAHRFRGSKGEVDLIMRNGDQVIFIEVKQSRTHARAAERLVHRQVLRLFDTASEFVANEPAGQDTNMRMDVAFVDGTGMVEIIENALAA
ncbi:YraN family protein [uncultured Litoreibacter sp.]|uniref:YraN family protein n=1 Tax=uncultured Litoreibacter sp. TaxID=1392394 RepID=UPI00261A61B6|nr:YraN family protein [uncultured Litoreibacter sp.]